MWSEAHGSQSHILDSAQELSSLTPFMKLQTRSSQSSKNRNYFFQVHLELIHIFIILTLFVYYVLTYLVSSLNSESIKDKDCRINQYQTKQLASYRYSINVDYLNKQMN